MRPVPRLPAAAGNGARRMPLALRAATYAGIGALWLSGCAVLALQLWWRRPGEFGLLRHPAEPLLISVHGVLAIGGLYLLGWLSARHVAEIWQRAERRVSGSVLLGVLGVLAVSGFALFFLVDERWRDLTAGWHDWLGAATLLPALRHWLRRRRPAARASR
jgi:hypothetical protein